MASTAPLVVDADGLITTYVKVPPDGGWAWVVLVAAFVVQIQFGATMLAVSSLVEAVAVEFHVTMSEASLFTSLFGGCAYCIGPVVSAMAHKYGFRTATSVGTIIGVIGFLAAYFADDLAVLVFTYGVLGGIGFGMLFVPSLIVVVFYFDRWRALAQGITVCGTSVGGTIAPPLFGLAVDRLGWRNTVLIQAAMLFSCGLVSLLYVPLTPVAKRVTPAELAAAIRSGASSSHRGSAQCVAALFRSPSYLMFGANGIFAMTCLMIPFVYWPDRCREMGLDDTSVELLVPVCNLASLLGRLACGLLASYPRPVALPIFNVTLVVAGFALCLSSVSAEPGFQLLVAVLYGLQQAAFNALRALILVEIIGLERLTYAIGFLLFSQGFSIMLGPPLAGQLKNVTGDYDSVFWFAGGLLLIGSLFVLPLSCVSRWEKRRAEMRGEPW